jgi:hypothetical protein
MQAPPRGLSECCTSQHGSEVQKNINLLLHLDDLGGRPEDFTYLALLCEAFQDQE